MVTWYLALEEILEPRRNYHFSCRISGALLGNAGGGTNTNKFQEIQ
jgi:hypothetical protein